MYDEKISLVSKHPLFHKSVKMVFLFLRYHFLRLFLIVNGSANFSFYFPLEILLYVQLATNDQLKTNLWSHQRIFLHYTYTYLNDVIVNRVQVIHWWSYSFITNHDKSTKSTMKLKTNENYNEKVFGNVVVKRTYQ